MKYAEHQIAAVLRISVRQAGTGRQPFNLHRRGTALQVNRTAWYRTVSETSISYTAFSGHQCGNLTSLFRNFGLQTGAIFLFSQLPTGPSFPSPALYHIGSWCLMVSVWRLVTFFLGCLIPGLKRKCPYLTPGWVSCTLLSVFLRSQHPTPPSRTQPRKHGVVDIATLVGLEKNLREK